MRVDAAEGTGTSEKTENSVTAAKLLREEPRNDGEPLSVA